MRYILLFLVIILVVLLIAFSDFFLFQLVKRRIIEINAQAKRSFRYKPITIWNTLLAGLAFWGPPLFLLGDQYLLEVRIFLTLIYWLVVAGCLNFYLRMRASQKTATDSMPYLVAFALAGGLLLAPALTALFALMER
jgi:hypothetical protein